MYYIGNAVTDVGNVKTVNQDSLTLKIANTKWGVACLAVVCDGVGGLSKGELASATVIRGFDQWFKQVFPYANEPWNEQKIQVEWDDLIQRINQKIVAYGVKEGVKLGTTVTAILFLEDTYYIAHVGDCRVYEMKDEVMQITKDQTLVQYEVDQGILTPKQAMIDPRKSVLLQSIGTSEQIDIAFSSGQIKSDATYLICTDGFRHEIDQAELFDYLRPDKNRNAEQILVHLRQLTELCKNRGERDNISSILLWVG